MALTVDEILELAYAKFEEEKYDEALQLFVIVCNEGYEKDTILQNLYNCYVSGNEAVFQETFERQKENHHCLYEACSLDFFPFKDGEYYIYNRISEQFEGVFSAVELKNTKQEPILDEMAFTPVTLMFNGVLERVFSILACAKNRKVYVICPDQARIISYFKIPEITEYMENVMIFSDTEEYQAYFHMHTAEYLPRIIFAPEEEAGKINWILAEEHQYRLTDEGRNTDNVLLTIGIPTHDRGNLLVKRLDKLKELPYDAEIEIAISKNGTHYFQEEYKQVSQIKDARINYVGYDRELTMAKNWQNVIRISNGKFVLLVSDEDDVIVSALEHYLNVLKNAKNLAHVRAKTLMQYRTMKKSGYYVQGVEAFQEAFLYGNYLSGAIYNRKTFMDLDLQYWDETYKDNGLYKVYPHLWWNALLAFQGDYMVDTLLLISEQDRVGVEEARKYKKDNVTEEGLADEYIDLKTNIPIPSTYESRMKQFWGGIELVNDYFQNDREMKLKAWSRLTLRTMDLMRMIGEAFHYKEDELPDWLGELLEDSILALGHLGVDKTTQKELAQNMLDNVKKQLETRDEAE